MAAARSRGAKAAASPEELIFFVTSRCHLRCRHCFNWQNLQRNGDLSLEEIDSLAQSLPRLRTLSLSGGEPFLRTDLVEICRSFLRHCPVRLIDIPTSGTLVEATVAAAGAILKLDPSLRLSIGISLDGCESYHDANRGVPGTFAKAVECCRRLLELKRGEQRLSVNILTTLVRDNRDEILALKEFVARNLPEVDHLSCSIARGEPQDGGLTLVSPEDLALLDRELLAFNARHQKGREQKITDRFQKLRREAFLTREQPVPCVAGTAIAVVYDEGSVAPCEMLPPVGNLRNASFQAIWESPEMQAARAKIASGACACTHECFLSPSFAADLKGRPLSLVQLEGIYGLYHYLYASCGLGVPVRAAGKLLKKARGAGKGSP